MEVRRNYGSYEDLMKNWVGFPDPSITYFIMQMSDVPYVSLFDDLVVGVSTVNASEYFDREFNVSKGSSIKMPIVLKSGIGDDSVEVSDDRLVILFVYPLGNPLGRVVVYYTYSERTENFYMITATDSMVTGLRMADVRSLRDLVDKLKGQLGFDDYVLTNETICIRDIYSFIRGVVDGDVEVNRVHDEFPFVLEASGDFGGTVTTLSTAGYYEVDTNYLAGDLPVGFEIIAGRLNDNDVTNDWFYEIVMDLYYNRVSLCDGFLVTGVSELTKLNEDFVGVILLDHDVWGKLDGLSVDGRHVDWFTMVPLTEVDLNVYMERGLGGLRDHLSELKVNPFDLSRKNKKSKQWWKLF